MEGQSVNRPNLKQDLMLDDDSQTLMGDIRLAEAKIKQLPKLSISFFSILPRALALSIICLQSCDILL